MKSVFLIAIVAVAMIGVMVPNVFAEEIHLDKDHYIRGEGIIAYITNSDEDIPLTIIDPNGKKLTYFKNMGNNVDGFMATQYFMISGEYTIQGNTDQTTFTLDAGQESNTPNHIFISDYLLYENQSFELTILFDYNVLDEPIVLEILDNNKKSIGSKTIPLESAQSTLRMYVDDFDFRDIGAYTVTATHAGTTHSKEVYYGENKPSVNTKGEYRINTVFNNIQKIPVTIENGIVSGRGEMIPKDSALQLEFDSFLDYGVISMDVPRKLIDAIEVPFIISIDNEIVEFEHTDNGEYNSFTIPFNITEEYYKEKYIYGPPPSGFNGVPHQLILKGTNIEGLKKDAPIQDTLTLLNTINMKPSACNLSTPIFTAEKKLVCGDAHQITIISTTGEKLFKISNFNNRPIIHTDKDGYIYVLDSTKKDENTTYIQKFTDEGKLIKTILGDIRGNNFSISYDDHLQVDRGSNVFEAHTLDGQTLNEYYLINQGMSLPPIKNVDSNGNYYAMYPSDEVSHGVSNSKVLIKCEKINLTSDWRDLSAYYDSKIIQVMGIDGNPVTGNKRDITGTPCTGTEFTHVAVDSEDNVYAVFDNKLQKFNKDLRLVAEHKLQHNMIFLAVGPDNIIYLGDSDSISRYTFEKLHDEQNADLDISLIPTQTTLPEIQISKNLEIASFVDPSKNPQHYIDRYNNEPSYKKWFDENYSQYNSIYEAVGLEEPVIEQINEPEYIAEPEYIPEPVMEQEVNCGTGTESVNGVCEVIQTEEKSSGKGGGCLIATATYGSEMANEVQQLRELRDNQLLNTESGTAFIGMFNDIYYSFSPIIADYERENPYFKEAVKLAITPLISTLSLMENAETESEVLSIGISVIVLNLAMYLGVPAIVVIGIRKRI